MKERDRLKALKQVTANPTAQDLGDAERKKKNDKYKLRTRERTGYARKLSQAGFDIEPKKYIGIVMTIGVLVSYGATFFGYLIAIVVLIALTQFLLVGYLEDRAMKRRRKVTPQLPPFIDGLVSALGTGYNLEQAIILASEGVPPGVLRSELDIVSNALNLGFSIKDALGVLRDKIAGREITSLIVSVGLFASMGGTALEPFRRLANKIREQQSVSERANRDLVMVKQAFFILFFLAIVVPLVVGLVQPDYIAKGFNDPLGKIIFQVGEIMIVGALLAFKNITTLKV